MKHHYVAIDYYLRRIASETVKEMSRSLVYYSYACPLYFFRSLLFKCTTFENLTGFLIPQIRSISHLGVDCCLFCIVESLQKRQSTVDSNFFPSQGFVFLIQFITAFVKLFLNRVDLTVLMRCVQARLLEGDTNVMLVVSKLVSSIGNVPLSMSSNL